MLIPTNNSVRFYKIVSGASPVFVVADHGDHGEGDNLKKSSLAALSIERHFPRIDGVEYSPATSWMAIFSAFAVVIGTLSALIFSYLGYEKLFIMFVAIIGVGLLGMRAAIKDARRTVDRKLAH